MSADPISTPRTDAAMDTIRLRAEQAEGLTEKENAACALGELYNFATNLERENTALTAKLERAERELQGAREALRRIERWFGEFPETGHFWPDGTPQSYGIAFGSNGERDYMRAIARAALQPAADGAAAEGIPLTETVTAENALNDALVENERLKEALRTLRKGWNDYTLHEVVDAALGAPKE